ncbi:MAG TPA: zf-HC2 domain-containing protein [candidate division Zixibacteria bacterium]|nr:zf-HC2 domain-containing protein [candidate division Zixibacteria bacterium]
MIDCREAVRRMWSYLEHALTADTEAELEAHLDTCVRCCGELEFSRHLRELVATSEGVPAMPPEVRARIERILVAGDRPATETAP